MIGAVYKWVGLVIFGMAALLATSALVQELRNSPDAGSVAFDLVFGVISAGIAASSGYSLFGDRGRRAQQGCALIVLVFGGLLLLTGGLLYALSIDSVEPPSPTLIGITLLLGVAVTLPSAVALWLLRRNSQ